MKLSLTKISLLLAFATPAMADQPSEELKKSVVENYADIVHANYADSLASAELLQGAIANLAENPTEESLSQAKALWLFARNSYGESEVYRFYEGPIDSEEDGPEGLLNAWPMDESYIDSVEGLPESGIIHNESDFPEITPELLAELNEKDGETNISSGWHAIEFLLWGQDFTDGGAGERPLSDFTSDDFAGRRLAYLQAAADLLVQHLSDLEAAWQPDADNYRAEFIAAPADESIRNILQGIGMMSGFELSGERILVALETQAQEDEHSCFSDNTHKDVLANAQGALNVYEGRYFSRLDRSLTDGPGIRDLAAAMDPEVAEEIGAQIETSVALAATVPAPFDQAILQENGRASLQILVDSLFTQAAMIQELASEMGLSIAIVE
ncbi:imelysin family protein [Puniceicoccus vermicola]|uniref:Iron-regulated protein n=1 Tax=Puniceicoccus vermicola TaxID=388746 RepID=A0A7X1E4L1_9BACT|nr:imelysin family protein [Puniceicoccus vermicola]MBC2602256.1 iron-regulated protein [Puniceicoccus vermicola]